VGARLVDETSPFSLITIPGIELQITDKRCSGEKRIPALLQIPDAETKLR